MAKIYFRMVTSYPQMKKWNEISPRWRKQTIKLLEDAGYTLNDDGTVNEPTESTES